MILETRNIIFSDDELVVALRPLVAARGLSQDLIPDAVACGMDEHDEVQVSYDFSDGRDALLFNSREVGAAVLNHCIELGIPLPRGSYKELTTRGEHVALIVRLETGSPGTGIENDDE